jgi:hypothetical protein
LDDHHEISGGRKMTEAQEKATRNFETAQADLRKQITGKGGASNEIKYGQAYQKMVELGLAPQLKSGYRIAKKYR